MWPSAYFAPRYFAPRYWTRPVPVVPPEPPIIIGAGGSARGWSWPWQPIFPQRDRLPRWLRDLLDQRRLEEEERERRRIEAILRDDEELLSILSSM